MFPLDSGLTLEEEDWAKTWASCLKIKLETVEPGRTCIFVSDYFLCKKTKKNPGRLETAASELTSSKEDRPTEGEGGGGREAL